MRARVSRSVSSIMCPRVGDEIFEPITRTVLFGLVSRDNNRVLRFNKSFVKYHIFVALCNAYPDSPLQSSHVSSRRIFTPLLQLAF